MSAASPVAIGGAVNDPTAPFIMESGSINGDAKAAAFLDARQTTGGIIWLTYHTACMAQDITHARTGDIVAIAGLKDVTTGDTLCDEKAPIVLERMEFPDPVIKVWRQFEL